MEKLFKLILTMSLIFNLLPMNNVNANYTNNELPFDIISGAQIKNIDGEVISEVNLGSNINIAISDTMLCSLIDNEDYIT